MNGTTHTSALSAPAKNVATALLATCCLVAAASAQVTLIPPPSISTVSTVTGLSANGRAASGWSNGGQSGAGFRWTPEGGRYDFGLESGFSISSPTYAISADGTTTVGITSGGAFRWRGPGTRQLLGIQSGYARSEALATNGDGSVVVGQSYTESGVQGIVASQAFRWTPTGGLQGLGFLRPNSAISWATGVSGDGTTVVGTNRRGIQTEAFIWTTTGGMTALPQLPGSSASYAMAISADGSTVLGISGNAVVQWRNGQPVDLGYPTGYGAGYFTALSGDGMVAGGRMRSASGSDLPAIWTPATGTIPFTQYLLDREIHIPAGVTLSTLNAISADGLTFGGGALSQGQEVGFIVTVPSPATLLPLGLLLACRRARPASPPGAPHSHH